MSNKPIVQQNSDQEQQFNKQNNKLKNNKFLIKKSLVVEKIYKSIRNIWHFIIFYQKIIDNWLTKKNLRPYLYGITANFCFVTGQIFFKMLTYTMQSTLILDIRSYLLLALNTYILLSYTNYCQSSTRQNNPIQLDIKDRKVFINLLKRLFWNTFSIWIFNISLKHVPLSIANALHTTSPILVFFIQSYFFHKPLMKKHFILTFVSFIGVIMISNPFKQQSQQVSTYSSFYLILPFLAAIGVSFSNIYLHQLKGKMNETVVLEYAYLVQTLYFHILLNLVDTQNFVINKDKAFFQVWDGQFILFLTLATLFTYGSHYFRVKSIFLLPPSKIMPYNYLGILLSLVYDFMIFGHQTNIIQILGILLTSIGLFSHLIVSLQKPKQSESQKPKSIQLQNLKLFEQETHTSK